MNRIVAVVFGLLLLLPGPCASAVTRLDLGGEGWSLQQAGKPETIPARVPGCVHTDLLAAGRITDPFFRDNEAKLQWISAETWEYRRKFSVPAEVLSLDHVLLRCEGLDTIASIRLNGKDLAHTDNMFRTWEFDVKGALTPADNTLEITFTPAADYMKAHLHDPAFPGVGVKKTGAIRKEACNFGWDWGPKLTTAGIWKPIALVGWNEARLSNALIQQDLHDPKLARLDIDLAAETDGKTALHTETTVTMDGAPVAAVSQPLRQADGVGRTTVEIRNPQRWWPAGMGKQALYEVRIVLRNAEGKSLDETVKRVGLRTVEWLAKTDARPLGLSVNGRPFFAKGVNWIPPTVFAPQVTPDLLRKYMTDAAAANMNIIRLWGGGYYEEDQLFDRCDELGILLWLDFKFASSSYPAFDPAFVANVGSEIHDNITRLRHHPSIAVWCGNNEVRLHYFVDHRGGEGVMSYTDYDNFFSGFIGGTVRNLVPQGVYTPGSPEAGDDHFWGVWHGNQPFEAYEQQHGMMTEYGFQSFPEPKTVHSFTEPGDRESFETPVMAAHQKSGKRYNEKIVRMIADYFHPGKDFDATLWLSQITQSYGVIRGIEHWRRDWPNSTGSIIWQYNDCWPGATWAIVDSFGRKKALMYQVAHAYAPLLVSAEEGGDGATTVVVSSDRMEACRPTLQWSLTNAQGTELDKGTQTLDVPSGTCSVSAATLNLKPHMTRESKGNLLLWLSLTEQGHVVSQNLHLFGKPKALQLVDPEIETSVTEEAGAFVVTLNARHPALWTWLELGGADADFSDNFVHLAAGQPVQITVKAAKPTSLGELKKQLVVRSLFDTFDPGAGEPVVAQAANGSVVAPATAADIAGTTAGLNDNLPGAVSGWESLDTVVTWQVKMDQPGRYLVAAETSCEPKQGGSTYTVAVGDQKLRGTVQAGKSWDDYATTELGFVEVDKPGLVTVTVQADTMPQTSVMNLRSLSLKPVASTPSQP